MREKKICVICGKTMCSELTCDRCGRLVCDVCAKNDATARYCPACLDEVKSIRKLA